jgi:hypothetical protein
MINPTAEQLEQGGDYELVDSVRHESVHAWIRPHLFTLAGVSGAYWGLNLAVLAFVLLIWRTGGLTLSGGFPILCIGMVLGYVVLLPLHEHIHAVAYRTVGAREVRVRYDHRRLTALCVAPSQVLVTREFIMVCLAPLVVLNPLLAIATLLVPVGAPALAVAGALLLHTGACSGDVAFVHYVWSRRSQRLLTFDDRQQPVSYFYRAKIAPPLSGASDEPPHKPLQPTSGAESEVE